jgi:hypothetical protein
MPLGVCSYEFRVKSHSRGLEKVKEGGNLKKKAKKIAKLVMFPAWARTCEPLCSQLRDAYEQHAQNFTLEKELVM